MILKYSFVPIFKATENIGYQKKLDSSLPVQGEKKKGGGYKIEREKATRQKNLLEKNR